MTSIASVGIRPGRLGAEITGVCLSHPAAPEVASLLRGYLARFGLIWFRDQSLDAGQLHAAAQIFGRPRPKVGGQWQCPEDCVLEIRRDADEDVVPFGAGWHTDGSFRKDPDSVTLLHAKVVPTQGGDTLFIDGREAYDALPAEIRRRAEGRVGLHSSAAYFGRDGFYAREQGRRGMRPIVSQAAEQVVRHPVVTTHAPSGRRTIYVNPGFTIGIEHEPTLPKVLFDHLTQERFVHRHRWAADMLAVWDNRCMLHSATDGYRGQQRIMHRIVIGDGPVA